MAYEDFTDLNRRTTYDKTMRGKAFNIAKNPKYDGYQRGIPSMVYKFFYKNPLCLQIKLLLVERIKMRIFQTKNLLKNYTNQLFKISRKQK